MSQDARSPARTLRVLTCNILAGAQVSHYHEYATRCWGAVLPGSYKNRNLDALGAAAGGFDIVGLQETDPGSLRSGFLDQTRRLAEAARLPYWACQGNRHWRGVAHTANGLISRREPCEVERHVLPGRGRGLLVARYGREEGWLVVAVAHLALARAARRRQAAWIVRALRDCPRVLLMGDLNCEAGDPAMDVLLEEGAFAAPHGEPATFPSWKPRRSLDHILARGGVEVVKRWVLPATASDHLPLAAEVRIPGQAGSDAGGNR